LRWSLGDSRSHPWGRGRRRKGTQEKSKVVIKEVYHKTQKKGQADDQENPTRYQQRKKGKGSEANQVQEEGEVV